MTRREQSLFASDLSNNAQQLSKAIQAKSVLVIGGAGTIGSSYIFALLPFNPKSLTVVDIDENGLTELTRDIRNSNIMTESVDYKTYPMSYSDPVFEKMFRAKGGFDIVANFSAHKHVRSEKDIYSIEALIRNNVINAKKLLDLLVEFNPQHFFCVSTDKAANPVNIMGASKKIMEDMIMAYSDQIPVTTARFANVAFSNGSLPFGFTQRMMKRQPLSAPSDIKRYFVSPEESGQICLISCMLGKTSNIFFPKLTTEHEMTFASIAEQYLQEQGYKIAYCSSDQEALDKMADAKDCYPVHFSVSNTSGEKPFEEFYTKDEVVNLDKFEQLGYIEVEKVKTREDIDQFIKSLELLLDSSELTKQSIVNLMSEFLENFDHIETGMNLDDKM